MKFTLIGSGFIMPRHADAIYTLGGKIADIVNTEHDDGHWQEVLSKTSAQFVSILGPNDLHVEMAAAAADLGKTVLCEKPLAIKSEDAKKLIGRPVFTVLQLHHHPMVKQLKSEIEPGKDYEIDMDISVYRDPHYYKSWKGQAARSGGVLFNLGIHYFDMLLHLFGQPTKIKTSRVDDKTGEGTICGKNYLCNWRVSTDERRDNQRRVFKINGVNYNFSSKDNLSYENLHYQVYKNLIEGKGVKPEEALKSIELVENLYKAQMAETPYLPQYV